MTWPKIVKLRKTLKMTLMTQTFRAEMLKDSLKAKLTEFNNKIQWMQTPQFHTLLNFRM